MISIKGLGYDNYDEWVEECGVAQCVGEVCEVAQCVGEVCGVAQCVGGVWCSPVCG